MIRAAMPLCLAVLLGCCHVPGHLAGPSGSQVNCTAVEGLLNPQGRLAALISVHAHALGGADHAEVLSLANALTVLQCDALKDGPLARSHKRRVVAELAAYGRLREFAPPIKILGADLSAIDQAVKDKSPYTYEYLLRNPAVLEMVISNLIAEHPDLGGLSSGPAVDPAPVCDWKQEEPFAVWQIGPTITVDGKISLDVPAPTVERNVDGQRWDECSQFWDPPPHATEIVDKLKSGGFQEASSPPPPGSDYSDRTLFEHFACDAAGCSAFFDNLLGVNNAHGSVPSQPSLAGYVVSYTLDVGLDGCIGSAQKGCPGGTRVMVKSDQGWLEVFVEKARTMVVTHKEVKFDNAIANGITQAVWTYAELAKELAEVACCLKASKP